MPCGAALEERRDRARPDRVPGAGQAGAAACAQKNGAHLAATTESSDRVGGLGAPRLTGLAALCVHSQVRLGRLFVPDCDKFKIFERHTPHRSSSTKPLGSDKRDPRSSERMSVRRAPVPSRARLPLRVVGTRGLGSENAPRPSHLPSPQRGKPYEEAWRAGHSTVSELDPPTRDPSSERDHSQTSASSMDNK